MRYGRVDFMGLIGVSYANPNGDPYNNNRPRTDSDGYGIISDVCIKRKLRDRIAEYGESILVSPPTDECDSLSYRIKKLNATADEKFALKACAQWYDVRAFGQMFCGINYKRRIISVRGAVSIQHAVSVHPVELVELPITRCIGAKGEKPCDSDTMGCRCVVKYGLYLLKGSVCASDTAKRNRFNVADVLTLLSALENLFDNDASVSRPKGSMTMERLYVWRHNSQLGQYPAAKVFSTIQPKLREGCESPRKFSDYIIEEHQLDGLIPEIRC